MPCGRCDSHHGRRFGDLAHVIHLVLHCRATSAWHVHVTAHRLWWGLYLAQQGLQCRQGRSPDEKGRVDRERRGNVRYFQKRRRCCTVGHGDNQLLHPKQEQVRELGRHGTPLAGNVDVLPRVLALDNAGWRRALGLGLLSLWAVRRERAACFAECCLQQGPQVKQPGADKRAQCITEYTDEHAGRDQVVPAAGGRQRRRGRGAQDRGVRGRDQLRQR